MYARTLVDPAMMLPNAVIYGWVDKNLPSGQPGSAHIVKVTAYSPGRCGSAGNVVPDCISNVIVPGANPHQIDQLLPWVQTSSTAFHHKFTLTDRDEHVYVKVQRWDQDHANALTFPNNLPLWQFAFHNPKASPVAPSALPSACFFSSLGGPLMGYGLTSGIQQALGNSFIVANVLPADLTAMGNAFMLNDEGTGPNAGSVDPNGKNPTYLTCLQQADALLNSGISSTACAAYVASDSPGTSLNNGSQRSDRNYKIYFLPCPTPLPPDDLTGHSPG